MKKQVATAILVLVIAGLPLIYLGSIWNSLPSQVPVHFDNQFKPDRMGDKSELWMISGILAVVSLAVYLLFQNIHLIDPKRRAKHSSTFSKMSFVIVVFIAAINFLIIQSAKGSIQVLNFIFPLLGLLFVFLGNYFNSIKPNYFAGYRLPWTLSSDENWRRTHQLAAKLWFWGGILFVVISLFLPSELIFAIFIGMVVVLVIIPSVFSYRHFKNTARH
jgi:uncharacterized membrane protein